MSSQNASISPLMQRIQVGQYDLTEYVLSCQVMKSLSEPAGFFSISLRPEIMNNAIMDFANIHINDFVEIRVGRVLVDTQGGKDAPIVMRGLVDAIEINEEYAQDMAGSPQRSVSISGRDLTKLIIDKSLWVPQEQWSDYSVERTSMILELDAKLDEANGEKDLDQTIFQEIKPWIEGIMEKVFKDPLVGMDLGNNVRFSIDVNLPKNNQSIERVKAQAGFTLNGFKGTLFNYIETYIARPFMEMFIEDYEDETKLKIRWAPFRDRWGDFPTQAIEHLGVKNEGEQWSYDGNARFWWDTKRDPYMSVINSNEIISKSIRRHSGDVYTYFFTTWGGFTPMDPRSSDKGIWDSSPKEVTNEQDVFISGPRKYLNLNPRFNPQYDFLGMKRFGLKPLVVAIPFWTQEDGEEAVSEERVIGEVSSGTASTGSSSSSSGSTTPITVTTVTIKSMYAYTIKKDGATITEIYPIPDLADKATNAAKISNSSWKSTNTTSLNATQWPKQIETASVLASANKVYTRLNPASTSSDMDPADSGMSHSELSADNAYSSTVKLPAGISGKISVLINAYASSSTLSLAHFQLINGTNILSDSMITVFWGDSAGSPTAVEVDVPADATHFRFKISAFTKPTQQDSFIADFYVTQKSVVLTTTQPSGATTTSSTVTSGSPDKDKALAWARQELNQNKQGYVDAKGNTYCERFTRLAFNSEKYYLTAWDNARANRTGDRLSEATLGDLVFFKQDDSNYQCGHVAIISKIENKGGEKNYFMIGALGSGLEERSINTPYWKNLFYGIGTGAKSYGSGARTKTVSATVTSPASGLSVPAGGVTKTVIVDRVMKEHVSDEISTLLDDCNQWMYDTLRQMDKCYAGKMRIIGNPFIKVGMELVVDDSDENNYSSQKSFNNRNSFNYSQNTQKSTEVLSDKKDTRERYYVESVHHSWSVFPSPNFITELGLTRGIFVSSKDVPFDIGDKGGFAARNSAYGSESIKKLSQAEKDAINPPAVEVIPD